MNESLEFSASERYFLETGQEFSKLPLTEQKKLMEAELDRESQGNVSSISGTYGGSRGYDLI